MAQWTEDEVRRLLAQFIGINKPTLLATVKSVDKTENTCIIDDDGSEIPSVRLRAITGENNGIVGYPKQGAYVLCVKVEDSDEWSVIKASEYESIEMTIESLLINGGDLGGLVKIEQMISWMQKVYNDLQALKTQLNTWPVVGNGSPLALVFTVTTPQPVKSDFEDIKIKH